MASSYNQRLPSADVLEDLATRFVLNVPAEELESFERMLFVVEEAHWYYEDFVREANPSLQSLGLKAFARQMFQVCPGLQPYTHQLDELMKRFVDFKQTVPVMGAIILNPDMTKILMVKGYKAHATWGFPRGKIAKGESDVACAVREVLEETGLDISGRIQPQDSIELHLREQRCKLFIIPGVQETTPFAPRCRKEIGAYGWHSISELPSSREEGGGVYQSEAGARHRFFNVHPFMRSLKKWIRAHRKRAVSGAAGQPSPSRRGAAALATRSAVTASVAPVPAVWPTATSPAAALAATGVLQGASAALADQAFPLAGAQPSPDYVTSLEERLLSSALAAALSSPGLGADPVLAAAALQQQRQQAPGLQYKFNPGSETALLAVLAPSASSWSTTGLVVAEAPGFGAAGAARLAAQPVPVDVMHAPGRVGFVQAVAGSQLLIQEEFLSPSSPGSGSVQGRASADGSPSLFSVSASRLAVRGTLAAPQQAAAQAGAAGVPASADARGDLLSLFGTAPPDQAWLIGEQRSGVMDLDSMLRDPPSAVGSALLQQQQPPQRENQAGTVTAKGFGFAASMPVPQAWCDFRLDAAPMLRVLHAALGLAAHA